MNWDIICNKMHSFLNSLHSLEKHSFTCSVSLKAHTTYIQTSKDTTASPFDHFQNQKEHMLSGDVQEVTVNSQWQQGN